MLLEWLEWLLDSTTLGKLKKGVEGKVMKEGAAEAVELVPLVLLELLE